MYQSIFDLDLRAKQIGVPFQHILRRAKSRILMLFWISLRLRFKHNMRNRNPFSIRAMLDSNVFSMAPTHQVSPKNVIFQSRRSRLAPRATQLLCDTGIRPPTLHSKCHHTRHLAQAVKRGHNAPDTPSFAQQSHDRHVKCHLLSIPGTQQAAKRLAIS